MADETDRGRLIADRYLLGDELGRGGMGVVWRAQDQLLGRPVAVKQVHLQPGLADAERHAVQQRVMREARAAAALNHAGAVTVYDVVEDGDQAYIVMELIEAPTLAELVAESGALPTKDLARVGIAVCDALAAAHERGIVHRDLKPANVLVADQQVKLTDFGIATVKDDPRLTSTGIVLGSPSYISPEQARGHQVTAATDVWGLGATLYFAATGLPPFDRGEAIATLTAVANDELAGHERAGALGPLLVRMLDKDPAARPSIGQVRDALSDVAAGLVPAVPPAMATAAMHATVPTARHEVPPPAAYDAPRRAWVAPAATAAAVALVVIALAVTTPWDSGERGAPVDGVLGQSETASAAASPTRTRSASPSRSPSPSPSPSADPGGITVDLPLGGSLQESHTDDRAGYSLRYPRGWQRVERTATITDFVEPGTGRYLRVDWTDDPKGDPKKDWEEQSKRFGESHDDYEEIRVESTEFRGYDAAIWEYRYAEDGAALHASNLAIVTEERGYALNFQSREADWDASQDLFDRIRDSFRIERG